MVAVSFGRHGDFANIFYKHCQTLERVVAGGVAIPIVK